MKKTELFQKRRQILLKKINQKHKVDGILLLFADFENDTHAFVQESSFYYLTGINEPAVALVATEQNTTLFVPNCVQERAKWALSPVLLEHNNASKVGVDGIEPLGEAPRGFQLHPFSDQKHYANLVNVIKNGLKSKKKFFVLNPAAPSGYEQQRLILMRLCQWVPELHAALIDVSDIVAEMRRKKSMQEIESIRMAIEITQMAHEAASSAIADGMLEAEVQASIEYVMCAAGARPSFPSIVGSGKNSTVLHYTQNEREMKNGDMVVVDIGAQFDLYCADLTRTYPVSGTFSKRQKEIYNIVLETQQYIADLAQPGMWLSNKEHAGQSLNHLAKQFIAQKGYGDYFPHGIGHYLGLDVHDVGSYATPLQEGDVITIEPGIYIPKENCGVRIEDNYWIVEGGAVCLSEDLPKKAKDIEQRVQAEFQDDEREVSFDFHDA